MQIRLDMNKTGSFRRMETRVLGVWEIHRLVEFEDEDQHFGGGPGERNRESQKLDRWSVGEGIERRKDKKGLDRVCNRHLIMPLLCHVINEGS